MEKIGVAVVERGQRVGEFVVVGGDVVVDRVAAAILRDAVRRRAGFAAGDFNEEAVDEIGRAQSGRERFAEPDFQHIARIDNRAVGSGKRDEHARCRAGGVHVADERRVVLRRVVGGARSRGELRRVRRTQFAQAHENLRAAARRDVVVVEAPLVRIRARSREARRDLRRLHPRAVSIRGVEHGVVVARVAVDDFIPDLGDGRVGAGDDAVGLPAERVVFVWKLHLARRRLRVVVKCLRRRVVNRGAGVAF